MTDQPKPTPKQLRLLRHLADQLGQTFTYPHTIGQASREIDRLTQIARRRNPARDRRDARHERRQIADDLARAFTGGTAIQPHELTGHGSTATWRER